MVRTLCQMALCLMLFRMAQGARPYASSNVLKIAAVDSLKLDQEPSGQLNTPIRKLVEPFSMSRVKLDPSSHYAIAQKRNQEFITSLDLDALGCIFTAAANLTECSALPSSFWQTYVKNATAPGGYTNELGFLSVGSDVKPAATVSYQECIAYCSQTASCKAVTFQSPVEVPTKDIFCYWKTAVNFVPIDRSGNCPSPGLTGQPNCQPLPGEMGLGGYYGHYQGHWLSAMAFMYNNTGNATVQSKAADFVARLADAQAAWGKRYPGRGEGYLFPYDPLVFEILEGAAPRPKKALYSVPWYTVHKVLAGMLDQFVFAHNAQALQVAKAMAGWTQRNVEGVLARGGQGLWQQVLGTEWGGMNEALFNLYAITGDENHLKTGRYFNHWTWTVPLAAGRDDLNGNHANTHIPEIIGNARGYELTGNSTDRAIVDQFLAAVTANHSWATAGSNDHEYWQAPAQMGSNLNDSTEESCTQYNMLKLSRHVFQWTANSTLFDFYERAIMNGILGNQNELDPKMTSFIYFLPLGGGGVKKGWGKSNWGFVCCWGTMSEQFSKLTDSIYFQATDHSTIFVNQFVSSAVRWEEQGVTVSQAAGFPASTSSTTVITVSGAAAKTFSMKIRVPLWATSASNTILLNGVRQEGVSIGEYFTLTREWKAGDKVEVHFPMQLWASPVNDERPEYAGVMAWMYGPLVLAGITKSDQFIPAGTTFKSDPSSFIKRTSETALNFTATDSAGAKMEMRPLFEVMEEQYSVYFFTNSSVVHLPPRISSHHDDHHAHFHMHARSQPHLAMPPEPHDEM